MPSRRQFLATAGTALATAGLAGCSGSGSGGSDTVDCQSQAVAHGDGDVLDGGAMADVSEDDRVHLVVPLSADAVRDRGVARLAVRDADDDLAFVVPVSADDADLMANKPGIADGQLRYEQSLGERPLHGRYEVLALEEDGTELDSVTVEFNCFTDVQT